MDLEDVGSFPIELQVCARSARGLFLASSCRGKEKHVYFYNYFYIYFYIYFHIYFYIYKLYTSTLSPLSIPKTYYFNAEFRHAKIIRSLHVSFLILTSLLKITFTHFRLPG